MSLLLTSIEAFYKNGTLYKELADYLTKLASCGTTVCVISGRRTKQDFDVIFTTKTDVKFVGLQNRQDGIAIRKLATKLQTQSHEIIVLVANDADLWMGKNAGCTILMASWVKSESVKFGIKVDDPGELSYIVDLCNASTSGWWFSHASDHYGIRALCDLSGYYKSEEQQRFSARFIQVLKSGGKELNGLLALTARSLLTDEETSDADFWGYYPSSSSQNDDSDPLADFTHRLRTTVTRVRNAKRGEPLLIRHKPTVKRSSAGGRVDRNDPTSELISLHLNPYYKSKIKNKKVVLIDDCTTYGLSFGVANALLKAAGARSLVCVAIGKLGQQHARHNISIESDPYSPLDPNSFSFSERTNLSEGVNAHNQALLLRILG